MCLLSYGNRSKYYLKGYINGCITFYDDTVSKIFEFKWVKIRALDDDGNLDDRCWSNVGSITEASQQSFQEINLSPKGCLFTKTIQVKDITVLIISLFTAPPSPKTILTQISP